MTRYCCSDQGPVVFVVSDKVQGQKIVDFGLFTAPGKFREDMS